MALPEIPERPERERGIRPMGWVALIVCLLCLNFCVGIVWKWYEPTPVGTAPADWADSVVFYWNTDEWDGSCELPFCDSPAPGEVHDDVEESYRLVRDVRGEMGKGREGG